VSPPGGAGRAADSRVTYTDDAGREWLVREIVSYASDASVGEFPPVDRAALVFESHGERRLADDAPIDWRDHLEAIGELFHRAHPLATS
jgi:hypothetical protein